MGRNTALIAWRTSHRYSQEALAHELGTTVRTLKRWESGETVRPHPAGVRALEAVTGLPIRRLGFPDEVAAVAVDDLRGGHDLIVRPDVAGETGELEAEGLSGVWLSRYEYFSSGREQRLAGEHRVVLEQAGQVAAVRSLSERPASVLSMSLEVAGQVVRGTWDEQTAEDGYYRGAVYAGSVLFLADPTGHRLTGKWLGPGRGLEINSGPWELTLLAAGTGKAVTAKYV